MYSSSAVISRAAALYPKDRPTKRSAHVEKSTPKKMKIEEPQKNPLDRYKNILVTAAGPQQTDYELSPLMTNIVENELNILMDKIYESFPKEITNEAEKVVYNKYKGQVGAALRNTIGMNITKRLLNVHDRLLVKLTFSSTPSGKDLDKFINNYKLNNFKKVNHLGHVYVADLKSYNDLDNLCSVKRLHCGNVEIIVKPCIPFMKCPQNLKTKFRSPYLHTEQKQSDTQSENIIQPKVDQQKTDRESEIKTTDDNNTTSNNADKDKAIENKEYNLKPKSQTVTKATTQNKLQETPKVTQKSQATNKVTENTQVSNIQTKTQGAAEYTQAKPEAIAKVDTTSKKTEESSKAKTTTIITEDTTKEKTIAIKTEKTTPTKMEESTQAKSTINTEKTTPRKVEETPKAQTTPSKTKETKPITIAPKTDSDKPKTSTKSTETSTTKIESSPKIKTAPVKSDDIPKPKTSEDKITTPAKTNTTKAKTTPPKIESAPSTTTPAKVSKTQDTPKTNSTAPKTQEQKVKIQNEVNKSTIQTKAPEIKKPNSAKHKEETPTKPQAKSVNTNRQIAKYTATRKEVINKNVKKAPERKKKESDFDELDDQDILAMLSGGIILDECSGSDDD